MIYLLFFVGNQSKNATDMYSGFCGDKLYRSLATIEVINLNKKVANKEIAPLES